MPIFARKLHNDKEIMKKLRLLLFVILLPLLAMAQTADECYNKATNYRNGWGGLKKDQVEAVKWFRKAAEKGHMKAQSMLALCYDSGDGVENDPTEALKWYKKASEQGDKSSPYFIGRMYKNGEGVPKDIKEAVKWFQIAAERDEPFAQEAIGELYEGGNGVEKNLQTAKEWYEKALMNMPSYKLAESSLERIEKKIAKQQSAANSSSQSNTTTVQPKQQRIDGNSFVDKDIPVISHVNKNTFALIIANENYSRETKVDYAKNDGLVFRDYCHKTLGLPEKNVHFVPDATLNDIIGELDWLTQVCEAFKGEASVIFYYAGHGIPDEASGSSYLLPTDGNSRLLRTCFGINELYNTLGSLPAKKVTVLTDACFSGAKRDGGIMTSARGVAIKSKPSAPKGNMIVLSAATGDETAYKYEETKHGLFTYFLLKKLKESKGSVTMGELSNYIQDQVGRYSIVENGKSQTPTVQASDALRTSWQNSTLY